MAQLPGWKFREEDTMAIDSSADMTEGLLYKITAATPPAAAVCGAGESPIGPAVRDLDVSEDGNRNALVFREGAICVGKVAAAVTINNYIKPAASGTVTPVTANNDEYIGRAITTQSTVGGYVQYILTRGFYGA